MSTIINLELMFWKLLMGFFGGFSTRSQKMV